MTTTALRMPVHAACANRVERIALRFAAAVHARAMEHMARRLEKTSCATRETIIQREALLSRHAETRRDAVARAHTGLMP